eukprot:scaffold23883_cov24-Tisochrysis_lutea.AAC.2
MAVQHLSETAPRTPASIPALPGESMVDVPVCLPSSWSTAVGRPPVQSVPPVEAAEPFRLGTATAPLVRQLSGGGGARPPSKVAIAAASLAACLAASLAAASRVTPTLHHAVAAIRRMDCVAPPCEASRSREVEAASRSHVACVTFMRSVKRGT